MVKNNGNNGRKPRSKPIRKQSIGDKPSQDRSLSTRTVREDDRVSSNDYGFTSDSDKQNDRTPNSDDSTSNRSGGGESTKSRIDRTPNRRVRGQYRTKQSRERENGYREDRSEENNGNGESNQAERLDENSVPKLVDFDNLFSETKKSIQKGTLAKTLEIVFGALALGGLGEHWALDSDEATQLGDALTNALNSLPKAKQTQYLNYLKKYFPWVTLIGTTATIVYPRIVLTSVQRKQAINAQNQKRSPSQAGSVAPIDKDYQQSSQSTQTGKIDVNKLFN